MIVEGLVRAGARVYVSSVNRKHVLKLKNYSLNMATVWLCLPIKSKMTAGNSMGQCNSFSEFIC